MESSRTLLAPLLFSFALCACDSGRQPLPNATVYAVHAASSYLSVDFRRETLEDPVPLGYGGAARRSYDADQYDFHVDAFLPASSDPVRVASFSQTLSADNDYYVILTDVGGVLDPVVVEEPAFDATSSGSEFSVFNAATALGAVDVYLEAPTADLAAATPLGSIGFGERIEPATFEAADYRLSLTEPGDPAAVLFRSGVLTAGSGQDNMLVIGDDAGQTLDPAYVTRVSNPPAILSDADAQVGLRALNVTHDRVNRDAFLDEDFSAPLFADLPFATLTDFATVSRVAHILTVTPVGDTGVLELEHPLSATNTGWYTFVFNGDASSELAGFHWRDDRRRIDSTARVRVGNVAARVGALDFLIVEPGTDLAEAEAQLQFGEFGVSQQLSIAPGDYEIGLRVSESGTVIAGPTPVTLEERGIYTVLAVDGADASSAELLLLDDFE